MIDMPCIRHTAITPNDSADIDAFDCIVVVSGGDVAFQDQFGTNVTYAGVPAMTVFEKFHPKRVLDTGTDATLIVGWKVR